MRVVIDVPNWLSDRLDKMFEKNVVGADAFKELFDNAPTIIESDETESEETK